jgi:hypothetical protein
MVLDMAAQPLQTGRNASVDTLTASTLTAAGVTPCGPAAGATPRGQVEMMAPAARWRGLALLTGHAQTDDRETTDIALERLRRTILVKLDLLI